MINIYISEQLELKQLELKDAPALFALIDRSRKSLRRFLPWVDYNTKLQHSENFIKTMLRKADELSDFAFGIWYDKQLCGVIDLHDWSKILQIAEIGYWIDNEFTGKGIARASCKALLDYAFTELKLNKVEIRFALENVRSAKIPIKLGFRREGTIRECAKLHGTYIDIVVMGMLKKDWLLLYPPKK